MKASEINVGTMYTVNGMLAQCVHAARGNYRFTPVGGGNEVVVTRAADVGAADLRDETPAPVEPTVEPTVAAPVSDPVAQPEVEPAYTARPGNQPHDCGLSSEGREAEAEREASELAYREWLAAQPKPSRYRASEHSSKPALPSEAELAAMQGPTVEPTPEPTVDPVGLVETEAPVSGPSATIHAALEAEWAAVDALPSTGELDAIEAALADAPCSPVAYTDDELAVYEQRWLAALSDTPPADQPPTGELGAVEVTAAGRELPTPPVSGEWQQFEQTLAARATRPGWTRARATRPRWARQQAKQRLLAGVR